MTVDCKNVHAVFFDAPAVSARPVIRFSGIVDVYHVQILLVYRLQMLQFNSSLWVVEMYFYIHKQRQLHRLNFSWLFTVLTL
jgi:hypothetical protein